MTAAATPRSVDKVLDCLSTASPMLEDEGRQGFWKASLMRKLLKEVDPTLTDAELDLAFTSSASGETINYSDFVCTVFGQPPSAVLAKPLDKWTESEVKTVLKVFKKFDKDNSCSLDVAELQTLCQVLGIEQKITEAEKLIKGGHLSAKEFFMMYVGCSEKEAAEIFVRHGNLFEALNQRKFQQWSEGEVRAVLKVFNDFDKDCSGLIDSSELMNMCQALRITEKTQEVAKLAKDGKLNSKEFFAWYVGCSPKLAGVVLARHGGLFESLAGKPLSAWSDKELRSVLQIFKDFDETQTGSFNPAEMRSLCDMLWGAGNDLSAIGVDKLNLTNGMVSIKEFFAFYVGCSEDEASAAFARL
mmetsp:Transcript_45684/g.85710  ORF Transcript_45684/g.85710 Transcript_45684/m.85710 type:complete len:358 (+) Transcript_45684:78-1151(+)